MMMMMMGNLLQATVERVNNLPLNAGLNAALANEIMVLWQSRPIQQSFARASEFQLPDSAA
jgi:hypothetical protein